MSRDKITIFEFFTVYLSPVSSDSECDGLSREEYCLLHNFKPSLVLTEDGKLLPETQRIANLRAGRNLLRDSEAESLKKAKSFETAKQLIKKKKNEEKKKLILRRNKSKKKTNKFSAKIAVLFATVGLFLTVILSHAIIATG